MRLTHKQIAEVYRKGLTVKVKFTKFFYYKIVAIEGYQGLIFKFTANRGLAVIRNYCRRVIKNLMTKPSPGYVMIIGFNNHNNYKLSNNDKPLLLKDLKWLINSNKSN